MWRLTSSNLPTEPTKRVGAPLAIVWAYPERGGAPVCQMGADREQFDLPEAQFVGYYGKITAPWKKGTAIVEGYARGNPNQAKVNTYWQRGKEIGFVAPSLDELEVSAKALVPVPIADENYFYQINFASWGNLSVSGVSSEGMPFFPASDFNQLHHPEWKFEDSILSFQAEPLCAPRRGGEMEIDLKISATFSASVLKFVFPSAIADCDLIEYLGRAYQITANPFPQLYQFLWDRRERTAFIFKEVA